MALCTAAFERLKCLLVDAYSSDEKESVFCFLDTETTRMQKAATEQRSSMGVSWVREIGEILTLILEV